MPRTKLQLDVCWIKAHKQANTACSITQKPEYLLGAGQQTERFLGAEEVNVSGIGCSK